VVPPPSEGGVPPPPALDAAHRAPGSSAESLQSGAQDNSSQSSSQGEFLYQIKVGGAKALAAEQAPPHLHPPCTTTVSPCATLECTTEHDPPETGPRHAPGSPHSALRMPQNGTGDRGEGPCTREAHSGDPCGALSGRGRH